MSRSAVAVGALLDSLQRAAAAGAAIGALANGDAVRVRDWVASIVLRAALALSVHPSLPSRVPPTASQVKGALEALTPWMESAKLSSPSLAASSPLWNAEQAVTLIDEEALPALVAAITDLAADGNLISRSPGVIHQELLEIGLARLESTSVRFPDANGVWVRAHDLLAQEPALRSKWLQRTAALPKSAVQRYAPVLAAARSEAEVVRALTPRGGAAPSVEGAGSWVVCRSEGRRRGGSHYTPAALRRAVVERALAPLLTDASTSEIRALRICDPSMGAGDFLVEVAEYLSERWAASEVARSAPPQQKEDANKRLARLRIIVTECLYGVDKDPVAVDLSRWALSRLVTRDGEAPRDLSEHLKYGDALVGDALPTRASSNTTRRADKEPLPQPAFHWSSEFPEIFGMERRGFDACIGNPPWVAYAGRAAQPLDERLARYYEQTNPAFHGYRTLHGLFVRRSAELLRSEGRLGLVLPTSVADLAGYSRTRAAHDALADADAELIDFGDGAFEAVFQPCMALTSTRRRTSDTPPSLLLGKPWHLARTDLNDVGVALLQRLAALPVLDAALFGERGFQTTGDDLSHLRKLPAPEAPFTVPIREGTDIAEFERRAPRTFLDPSGLKGRLRPLADYQRVEILIRQTARYPIAALSDGAPFRNSLLAGFSNEQWTANALTTYLNSSAVRFYHYARHRDARQGMPQLKIGHLRALPTVTNASARRQLDAMGARVAVRNSGVTAEERDELDAVVFEAFELSEAERELVTRFAAENRPPVGRRRG